MHRFWSNKYYIILFASITNTNENLEFRANVVAAAALFVFYWSVAFICKSESMISGCRYMGVTGWLARCYSSCLYHLCSWKE